MKKVSAKPGFYIMDQDLLQHGPAEIPEDVSASAEALLKNILQGLEASLKALAIPNAQGKTVTPERIAALCRESGLHPEIADKVLQEFLAQTEGSPSKARNQLNSRVKMCPAFNGRDGNGICTGKACGLSCISMPL